MPGPDEVAPLPNGLDSSRTPGDLISHPRERDGRFAELRIDPGMPGVGWYLGEGWSLPERKGRWVWSEGPRSTIRFLLDEPRRLALDLRGNPYQPPGGRPQRIHVFANGVFVRTLDLAPSIETYHLELPAEPLRSGRNVLAFEYDWTEAPRKATPGSKDYRQLALSLRELVLRAVPPPPPLRLEPVILRAAEGEERIRALRQADPGSFSYLLVPPASATLELGWWLRGEDRSSRVPFRIEAEWDDGRRVLHEGIARVGGPSEMQALPLPPLGGGALRLRLAVESLPEGAEWFWLAPRVRAGEAAAAEGAADARSWETLRGANVVVFLFDAGRRSRFGVYGAEDGTTPHIDAFAREALVFDAAFTQASYTISSTASLFTSRIPAEHAVLDDGNALDERFVTMAEGFREAGYATAAFTGNAYVSPRFGLTQGFEDVDEVFRHPAEGQVARAAQFYEPVVEWIRRHRDHRFFVYVHYVQPHEPYNAAPDRFYTGLDEGYLGDIDGSQEQMREIFRGERRPTVPDIRRIRRLYDGNLRYADAAAGRILDSLKEMELLEKSIVVLTADHGESLGERGSFGHGHTVDGELISLPLMVRLPAVLGLRGRSSQLVASIDLMPTLLRLVGAEVPPGVQGRVFLGDSAEQDAGWPRSIVSIAEGRRGTTSVVIPGFKYSYENGVERLMSLPEQESSENLRWERPVTFAYLAAEAVRLNTGFRPDVGAEPGELTEEERESLRALGYVVDEP